MENAESHCGNNLWKFFCRSLLACTMGVCVLLLLGLASAAGLANATGPPPPLDYKAFEEGDGTEYKKGGPAGPSPVEHVESKISYRSPKLSEEEGELSSVPLPFKCDACAAIAYRIEEHFRKAEARFKEGRPLRETEMIDAMETACGAAGGETCPQKPEVYNEYGIKGVADPAEWVGDRKNLLVGPGLPEGNGKSGMVRTGGKWPQRLCRRCLEIVNELEEE